MLLKRTAQGRRANAVWTVVIVCFAAVVPLAGASHGDGSYDMPVWFYWDTPVLDVIVVPPNHGDLWLLDPAELDPYENSYMRAVMDSIADWQEAIAYYGPSWLSGGVTLNVYVLGQDEIPQAALEDPEIVVTTLEEHGAYWAGVAVYLGKTEPWEPEYPARCVISNTKIFVAPYTYREMYSLNAHEFGHCLGLDHPGADSGTDYHPVNDVMAYGPLSWEKCASNLDVKGIQYSFAPLFGEAGGAVATVPVGSYEQYDCVA